jgi:hypothetical protein
MAVGPVVSGLDVAMLEIILAAASLLLVTAKLMAARPGVDM